MLKSCWMSDFSIPFSSQEVITTWTRNLTGNPPRVSPSAAGSLLLHGDWLIRGSLSCYQKKEKRKEYKKGNLSTDSELQKKLFFFSNNLIYCWNV